MTADTTDARLARLRTTRDRLEAQLADPKTPPYSVAPLSNQLRLADKEIDRIMRREEAADDGLPTTPDRATILDFMKYAMRQHQAVQRTALNAWGRRELEIHDEWEAAGFAVLPRPDREDDPPGRTRRQVLDDWADACRAELVRCLDARPNPQPPKESQNHE